MIDLKNLIVNQLIKVDIHESMQTYMAYVLFLALFLSLSEYPMLGNWQYNSTLVCFLYLFWLFPVLQFSIDLSCVSFRFVWFLFSLCFLIFL